MQVGAGDVGLIPGSGRSPGGGSGNPLQYSCLGNPMDRGGWWTTVHGVAKSQTRLKRLSSSSSSPTLCDPMDSSPSASSVHGISQASILEWVATSSSRGFSQPRNQTCISCIGRWILYHCTSWEALIQELKWMLRKHTCETLDLWKILKDSPDHLTCLLRNLYARQEVTVRTGHETTDWF